MNEVLDNAAQDGPEDILDLSIHKLYKNPKSWKNVSFSVIATGLKFSTTKSLMIKVSK